MSRSRATPIQGLSSRGDQSLAHVFTGCILQGRDTGLAGINTARRRPLDTPGVYRVGKIKWYGGTIMENQIADLYLGRQSNGPVVVSGCTPRGAFGFSRCRISTRTLRS